MFGSRLKKYTFQLSNRLDKPFDDVPLTLTIKAQNPAAAHQIAAEFGFKYSLLLTAEF